MNMAGVLPTVHACLCGWLKREEYLAEKFAGICGVFRATDWVEGGWDLPQTIKFCPPAERNIGIDSDRPVRPVAWFPMQKSRWAWLSDALFGDSCAQ